MEKIVGGATNPYVGSVKRAVSESSETERDTKHVMSTPPVEQPPADNVFAGRSSSSFLESNQAPARPESLDAAPRSDEDMTIFGIEIPDEPREYTEDDVKPGMKRGG